jgi:hypothetical protein
MSNPNPPMIKSTAMPQQTVTAMPPGSKGPMDAGIKTQQQQTDSQMALIGKSGGSKRRNRRFKGGATTAPAVQVPPVQAGVANPDATAASYAALTNVATTQQVGSTFDSAKDPSQTAALQAQQQSLYKSGGSKSRRGKRGKNGKRGGSVNWGCYSGGKKSKKRRKSRSRSKRTKRHHH